MNLIQTVTEDNDRTTAPRRPVRVYLQIMCSYISYEESWFAEYLRASGTCGVFVPLVCVAAFLTDCLCCQPTAKPDRSVLTWPSRGLSTSSPAAQQLFINELNCLFTAGKTQSLDSMLNCRINSGEMEPQTHDVAKDYLQTAELLASVER